ncbi:MAG: choice-of-anchor D domain-containing protein [Polyangiaceae bacterium]
MTRTAGLEGSRRAGIATWTSAIALVASSGSACLSVDGLVRADESSSDGGTSPSTDASAFGADSGGGIDVPASTLKVSSSTLDFGYVPPKKGGNPIVVTITNTTLTMTGPLSVRTTGEATALELLGDTCSGVSLVPGSGACALSFRWTPTPLSRLDAVAIVTDSKGSDARVNLVGFGGTMPSLLAEPDQILGGTISAGQSVAKQVITISNPGSVATGNLTTTLTGTSASSFGVTTNTCDGMPLAPNGTCTIRLAYSPYANTYATGTLTVTDGTTSTRAITLSGGSTEYTNMQFTPPSVDLGTMAVGTSVQRSFVLRNQTGQSAQVYTAEIAPQTEATILSDGCSGMNLVSGASCTIGVQVTPTTYGSKGFTLSSNVFASGVGTGAAGASITAVARQDFSFTIDLAGAAGGGWVETLGAVGNANAGRTTVVVPRSTYAPTLTLVPHPRAGYTFAQWSGACTGRSVCVLPTSGAASGTAVVATFSASTLR